jgi:hypothetical protein
MPQVIRSVHKQSKTRIDEVIMSMDTTTSLNSISAEWGAISTLSEFKSHNDQDNQTKSKYSKYLQS